MFYPLYSNALNEDEMKGILKVLRQGNFIMGEQVDLFEKTFATKLGFKYAVMVNSGSGANLAAVAALTLMKDGPLRSGDEVIVPALGWPTTYSPLHQYGFKLRFVDCELSTLGMDPKALEAAFTPKTRLVVAINTLGNPAQMDLIKQICRQKNAYLLEDCCDALTAELKGRNCGAFGDVATFSLGMGQAMSTMEGGVVVTENKDLYHILKAIRAYGWTREVPPQSSAFLKPTAGPEDVRFVVPGYNLRPLEISAAIAVEQLKRMDGIVEVRRQNACLLYSLLQNDRRFILPKENGKPTWHSFPVLIHPSSQLDRVKLIQKLADNGIQTTTLPLQNITRHDVVKHFQYDVVSKLDVANLVQDWGFVIGNASVDLTSQIERLHRTLASLGSPSASSAPPKKSGFPFAA